MVLHQDVPDRFVDVTEQEHQEKGSVEQIIGNVNGGLDQKEHEQDGGNEAAGTVQGEASLGDASCGHGSRGEEQDGEQHIVQFSPDLRLLFAEIGFGPLRPEIPAFFDAFLRFFQRASDRELPESEKKDRGNGKQGIEVKGDGPQEKAGTVCSGGDVQGTQDKYSPQRNRNKGAENRGKEA